jgi:predicted transcriptional regulator
MDDPGQHMKYVMLPVLAVLVFLAAGCAKSDLAMNSDTAASLQQLARACINDRQRIIREAWQNYERRNQRQVVFPDWRVQAVSWARVECERGRAIERFRP